jgi:hypothetical protein
VRDVAWDGGWSATVSVDGGPARVVPVVARGLVQQVRLPAGADDVTFAYQPPHWVLASTLSGVAASLLALLLVVQLVRRHRHRRRRAPSSVSTTVGPPVPSAEGVSQRQKELSLVGSPHGVDDESGGS